MAGREVLVFLLGLGHLRLDPYLPVVVIFMKIGI
jgi:hypothetical protein